MDVKKTNTTTILDFAVIRGSIILELHAPLFVGAPVKTGLAILHSLFQEGKLRKLALWMKPWGWVHDSKY